MRISIITPSYNQGKYIERTIVSVLSQQGVTVEYRIMDAGSSDQTVEILKKYQSRLKWVSETDRGQADAVNKGIACSSGEIIGWLNSDDIYYPDALLQVSAFFEHNPQVDIVYGLADFIDETDSVLGQYPTESWSINRLQDICFLCQPAVFFRRRVVEACGLLDIHLMYCMDYEYWLRLAMAGMNFVCLHSKLAGSRVHSETKTTAMRVPVHEEMLSMLFHRLGRVPDRWVIGYACVMTEEKGLNSADSPVRFVLSVISIAWRTAIRFNNKISLRLVCLVGLWLINGIRSVCKCMMARSGNSFICF